MRVLQINSVCGTGSTGRIMLDIHNTLKNQGHESYMAYGRDNKNCPDENTIRIGNDFDIKKHGLKTRLFDRHGFGSRRSTIDLIKKIEELNPDIIHLHNIHGYYINIVILFDYIKKNNINVLWTLHDCWAFTGHCVYFEYVNCNKWKTGCENCPQKTTYPKSWLLDQSRKNYIDKKRLFSGIKNLTIVTPSNWLKELVEQSFLNPTSVKTIHNGVDLSTFYPRKTSFNNLKDKFVILGVANVWEKRKGYKYFLELSEKISSDDIIVLVGLSKNQIGNLPSNIIGYTRTESVDELAKLYSRADVFLNPTLEDNFPTTNIEALACGTPVITFETGGSPEAIKQKNIGIITKTKSIDAIIGSISEIKRGKFKKRTIRESVVQFFNKEDRYLDYLNMYHQLLEY